MTEPIKPPRGRHPWAMPALLLLVLAAMPALAQDTTDSAPTPATSALADDFSASSDASMAPSDDASAPSAWSGPKLLGVQFGAGALAAAVSVPLTLWGASAVGGLSNNLFGAALPSLLMLLVVPPLLVTLTEVLVGNALGAHSELFPALWVALGTQFVAIVGGILLGVYAGNPTHVALFTLGEAILLPGAATLMLGLSSQSEPRPLSGAGRSTWMLPPVVSMPIFQGAF